MEVLRGWVEMQEKLDGEGGMEMKSTGTDGDGCNFCQRAGLYRVMHPNT